MTGSGVRTPAAGETRELSEDCAINVVDPAGVKIPGKVWIPWWCSEWQRGPKGCLDPRKRRDLGTWTDGEVEEEDADSLAAQ